MTPLDDELRTALRSRADALPPAPDPMAGIEARARGLRRRQVATAVTGAALAVAALVVAVPAVVDRDRAATDPRFATTGVTTAGTTPGALDPASPWPFRGTSLSPGTLEHVRAEWRLRHPGSTLTPLFAQVWEPSGQQEAAFVATGPDGDRYGWVEGTESGARFRYDEPLAGGTAAMAFRLPGDEGVERLVLLAEPGGTAGSADAAFTPLAPGVAVTPLERHVDWAVHDGAGTLLASGAAEPTAFDRSPANLLTWPARGLQDSSLLAPARTALGPSLPGDGEVLLQVLFTGDTDSGVRFVTGQVWRRGDALAHSFAYAEGGTNGPQVFLGPVTPADPELLAFLVDSLPGTTTDLLVVIPRTGAGQVSYDSDATGRFSPVANGRSDLNGVGLVDRSRTATADRLEVLDGDGNLDRPLYRGPVAPLLCGMSGCG